MPDDHTRVCGICGEVPVEPPHIACPSCFTRADWIAKNDPYWWMEGRQKPQAVEADHV